MARASVIVLAVAAFAPARAYVVPTDASLHGVAAQTMPAALHLPEAPANKRHESSAAQSSWNPLMLGLVLGVFAAAVGRAPVALAADVENGGAVFAGNCSACHAGGNNSVSPDKKLNKESLQKYGKYEPAAIVAQITKGNGAMPAFGTKLGPEDISDLAAYVREQADKGW